VRYVWSDTTGDSAHWDQAFAIEGKQDWEINSIIQLTRP
jgi:hypothetical protein